MVRTQIQLTEEQASLLKELSAQTNVSMAALIRQAIDGHVAHRRARRAPEVKARALEAIGCLAGGPPNLAEDHDHYLADAYAE